MRMLFHNALFNLRAIVLLCIFLITPLMHAVDFAGPKKAISVTDRYDSISWDLKAGGWVRLKDVKTITTTYDASGRILAQEIRYDKNLLIEKTVYAYSKTGWTKTTYNHENKVARTAEAAVTGGRVVETTFDPEKNVWQKITWEKDANGNPYESELFDGADGLVWRMHYEYDERGNCTKISYRNPDGSIAFESDFEYEGADAKGNWTSRTEYCTYADVNRRGHDVINRSISYAK